MRIADWNGLDWALVAILVVSMGMGFSRGLIRTVFGLVGLIAGVVLAAWKYTRVAYLLTDAGWIRSMATARFVGYLLIVGFVFLGIELSARLVHRSVRAVGLGFMDRILGAGLGLARGWVIGTALVLIPTTFAPQSKLLSSSALSVYFVAVAHDVSFLVPQYMRYLIPGG